MVNRLGLHARAAARLVRLSAGFTSRIILIEPVRNVTADSKSILSVLTLSASIGSLVLIKVEGEDEDRAFEAVEELFRNGFGEQ